MAKTRRANDVEQAFHAGDQGDPAGVLKSLQAAFVDAEQTVGTLTDPQAHNVVETLCRKAGEILWSLVQAEVRFPDRFPWTLEQEPLMLAGIPDAEEEGGEGDVRVSNLYWLAFIGWGSEHRDVPIATAERYTIAVYNEYTPGNDYLAFDVRVAAPKTAWPQVCRASVQAIVYLLGLLQATEPANANIPGLTDGQPHGRVISNPSVPLCKNEAATAWGRDMTVKKLSSLMKSGKIRYLELNRQTFIFDRDQIPSLPGPQSPTN